MAHNKNTNEKTHVHHEHEHHNRKQRKLTAHEEQQRKQILLIAGIIGGIILLVIAIGLVDSLIITPNRVVASVGDDDITVEEYRTRARYYRWQLLQSYAQINQIMSYFGDYDGTQETQLNEIGSLLSNPELLADTVINSMIQELIINQKADELKIEVSDEEVMAAIEGGFSFYPDGTPTAAPFTTAEPLPTLNAEQLLLVTATPTAEPTATLEPTEEAEVVDEEAADETAAEDTGTEDEAVAEESVEESPTATPAPTATVYTVELFDENYASYLKNLRISNISEKDFIEIQRMILIREAVFEVITADVPDTEEQIWIRHILTGDEAGALSAKGQVESGSMSFEEMANMLSIDDSTASTGGDLGRFTREDLETILGSTNTDALFALEVGEVSDPIQTTNGYHIFQIIAHDETKVSSSRYQELQEAAFSDWLDEQRTALDDTIVINEELRDGHTPSEPSFNDPDVYEAIFGISSRDARATTSAYYAQSTEQAATLAAMPTLEPTVESTVVPTEVEE